MKGNKIENIEQIKWHQKPISIILLLIFFFPVGLYFMWKNEMWNKKIRWIITGIAILLVIADFEDQGNQSVSSIENTQKCLLGYDWVYPSGNNPSGAWKFSSDGTFNSSTTMFGGMSTWGNWTIISPGKIKVSYTRTSEGTIPNDQVLTLSGCFSLIVGSTTYVKE